MRLDLSPSDTLDRQFDSANVLLIACGALAREIVDLIELNNWKGFDLTCLPAKWHNTPEKIVPGIKEKIKSARHRYQKIYVLYGDCGTGGQLDTMLKEEGVERIDGPHCYAFFTGNPLFEARANDDMMSFFLTDYLARQFDKLVWEGLGLDRHPELLPDYFQHYKKLVYLAQTKDEAIERKAEAAAKKLRLEYEYRFTGYGELADVLKSRA